MQIQQCFNQPYADQTTTTPQQVDHCGVISSNTSSTEATEAIREVSVVANVLHFTHATALEFPSATRAYEQPRAVSFHELLAQDRACQRPLPLAIH